MSDTTRLDEIRQREAAATRGPWDSEWQNGDGNYAWVLAHPNGQFHPLNVIKVCHDDWPPSFADAAFVAAARSDVPWLVAEVERLRDERVELWSCPACAFTFDAMHVDADTGEYSCPACAELRLTAERDAALAAIQRVRDLIAPGETAWRLYKVGRVIPEDEIRAALGTVGQVVCPHCEVSGRCVGSCLDDPREER